MQYISPLLMLVNNIVRLTSDFSLVVLFFFFLKKEIQPLCEAADTVRDEIVLQC